MTTPLATPRVEDAGSPTPAAVARRARWGDAVAVASLVAAFPVVHDVRTMLTAPYWLDEAWVALSVRFPLHDILTTTFSTPVGWTLLLRLVPDTDYLRLVPLLFHGVALVAAYALGRLLGWPSRGYGVLAGLVCGGAVLLLPAQQVRHDLKQYTADAAVTLCLLALGAWIERRWSRRRLAVLAAAVPVGMLFSYVTAVAAPGVLGGLLVVTLARRQWPRVVEVLVVGTGTGAVVLAIYLGISSRAQTSAMREYWAGSLPGFGELPGYLGQQAKVLTPFLGAPVPVVLALFVAGVLTVFRYARPGTAVAIVWLPVAALVLGLTQVYPLLELRTSHFLLVTVAAVAGLGTVGAVVWLAELGRRVLPFRTGIVAVAVACALLLAGFTAANRRWLRFDGNEPFYYTAIGVEDVRSATYYVAAHRAPQDVIVVSLHGRYGFAFYWPQDRIRLVHPYHDMLGWTVDVPGLSGVVFITGTDAATVRQGLDRALTLAAHQGPTARVWLIRSHMINNELAAWRSVLTGYTVTRVTGGVEPVALLSRA
jgi:hypothetical protein